MSPGPVTAPAHITIGRNVSVEFPSLVMTGDVVYMPEEQALVLFDNGTGAPERLSVNLQAYNLLPQPGHVFIKDWSEGSGVARSLTKLGLVELVDAYSVGPFSSTAFEVRVIV